MFRISSRRWITAGAGLVLAVLFLVGVPLPYQRTVGHEVKLNLSGNDLEKAQLQQVAAQMRSLLHSQGVSVAVVEESGAGSRYTLTTDVPRESKVDVPMVAEALAASLRARGLDADASVERRTERISGTLLAMAQERIIEISVDGKSAAELEAEISQALTDAGMDYAEVSVEEEPGGSRRVSIEARQESDDPGAGEPMEPTIVLTSDGQPLAGDSESERSTCRIMKKAAENGTVLTIEVAARGRESVVDIENPDAYSDSDLASEIERRLAAEGVTADVTVENGRVAVSIQE